MDHQPVHIVPYDPGWTRKFADEKRMLAQVLAPYAYEIAHIGSTAVPKLPARPIIDIAVQLDSLAWIGDLLAPLSRVGYLYMGHYGLAGRQFFVKEETGRFHLSLVDPQTDLWVQWIRFRDLLRADEAVRNRYLRMKIRLAAQYGMNRKRHDEEKSKFICAMLAKH